MAEEIKTRNTIMECLVNVTSNRRRMNWINDHQCNT